ncbi:hypothetical protein NM208_g5944 [Fusarium decemcellulare]|uniref:Uncharacterized protein n=1 Tax=Fusarium decemcellulare TaxID=57161 RepID=A0ACC1SF38_9HYPO|nr:hypothetical protein NM208_g5944 [Fusarium decemcellulare]
MLKTQGLTPVTTEQGMAVAKKMSAQYMECSSKEMRGVDEIFEQAILTVVANDRKTLEASAMASGSTHEGRSSLPGKVPPGNRPTGDDLAEVAGKRSSDYRGDMISTA